MPFSSSNAFAPIITGGGLSLHVDDGVLFSNGVLSSIAASNVSLVANATNYVYVDLSSGLVTSGLSLPSSSFPIATVVTTVNSIRSLVDTRADVVGAPGASEDGWIAAGETWVFGAADAPSYTFTIAGIDRTAKYTPGTRIKLTQSAAVKYFIVTKVSFSTDTTVTVYGGTDYTLGAAITLPFFSRVKAPAGFNLDPAKWTETFTDTTDRAQASPVLNTWYNIGTLKLSVPVGVWDLNYVCSADVTGTSGTADIQTSLSTSASAETDTSLTHRTLSQVGAANIRFIEASGGMRSLTVAAKTDYFLIFRTGGAAANNIDIRGDVTPTIIRAVSEYL